LYYALSRSKFNRIISYMNTGDIWHALEITHKIMNQVNE
jgi:hypothetical protein